VKVFSSEALYQACRYPFLPEVQMEIITQKSPMTAKMKSKKYKSKTRHNWDNDKLKIMRWCLRVKLFHNWHKFSELILDTGEKPIVEESIKDDFWGAKPVDLNLLIGINALGRLLMELRTEVSKYEINQKYILNPPQLENFLLLGKNIENTILSTENKIFDKQEKELIKQLSINDFL
jgi:ribA/ribD-fused uncharacterized protein